MNTKDAELESSDSNNNKTTSAAEENQKIYEHFTGAQKRRINAMIGKVIDRMMAKRKKRELYAKYKSSLANAEVSPSMSTKKHGSSTPEDAQQIKKPKVHQDKTNSCKIAIADSSYPEVKLDSQQLEAIKSNLLYEIDKLPGQNTDIGFVTCVDRDGWVSLTCCNEETKEWVTRVVPTLSPFPNAKLKTFDGAEMFVCIAYIPSDEVLPHGALMKRLSRQNGGLSTTGWRVLKLETDKHGGENITISVDAKSREIIAAHAGKLFLNFTQIQFKKW